MTHYICTGGCKGVSDDSKECGAKECSKHGQPLTPCECSDNNHTSNFGSD